MPGSRGWGAHELGAGGADGGLVLVRHCRLHRGLGVVQLPVCRIGLRRVLVDLALGVPHALHALLEVRLIRAALLLRDGRGGGRQPAGSVRRVPLLGLPRLVPRLGKRRLGLFQLLRGALDAEVAHRLPVDHRELVAGGVSRHGVVVVHRRGVQQLGSFVLQLLQRRGDALQPRVQRGVLCLLHVQHLRHRGLQLDAELAALVGVLHRALLVFRGADFAADLVELLQLL